MSSNFINFYKDCYEADTRTVSLQNFFSQKVEHRLIFDADDELICGHMPRIPLDEDYAKEILHTLNRFEHEKSLYVFTFFLIGRASAESRSKICAPLFFYPAEIVLENSFYYLTVDFSIAFPNSTFLERIRKDNTLEIADLFDTTLSEPLTFESVVKIKQSLEEYFTQIDTNLILSFPTIYPEPKLKNYLRKAEENQFKVIPSVGCGVMKHSTATLGILSELTDLITKKPSRILHNLLTGRNPKHTQKDYYQSYVPAVLSPTQKDVIQAVSNYDHVLIIGPPGTGKSYTIASLAVDQINKGKSVLILSKTDQAVDVVHDKIEDELGIQGIALRAGRKDFLRNLKSKLKNILSGLPARYVYSKENAESIKNSLHSLQKELGELKEIFQKQVIQEEKWGEFLSEKSNSGNLFHALKKQYISWKNSKQVPHWDIVVNYYKKKKEVINLLRQFAQYHYEDAIYSVLKYDRNIIKNFYGSIRSRTLAQQHALFKKVNFSILFKAFPLWSIKLSDVYKILPNHEDLFDVVIIDEATQCDIAQCLPALHRAKKVVIVGDPMQLRHFSFLSRRFLQITADKHNLNFDDNELLLNYRDHSILDIYFEMIENQEQVLFLDEHFRGNSSLINFSNQVFYDDKLKVMKSLPSMLNNQIEVHHLNGKKDKNSIIKAEADLILDRINKIITEEKEFNMQMVTSIGIVSPFRNQAEYLESQVYEKFHPSQITRHKIKVGTPYSFQGDERDEAFISWAIDANSKGATISYLNTPEMFNVAITRSRKKQHILISCDQKDLPKDSLIFQYLQSIKDYIPNKNKNSNYDDFLKEVINHLKDDIADIHIKYDIAGVTVDLLFKIDRTYFGIDVIGFPGDFSKAISFQDYEILYRSGVTIIPLPYSNWYFDKFETLKEIKKLIHGNAQEKTN